MSDKRVVDTSSLFLFVTINEGGRTFLTPVEDSINKSSNMAICIAPVLSYPY
jgi:hypothetical protein